MYQPEKKNTSTEASTAVVPGEIRRPDFEQATEQWCRRSRRRRRRPKTDNCFSIRRLSEPPEGEWARVPCRTKLLMNDVTETIRRIQEASLATAVCWMVCVIGPSGEFRCFRARKIFCIVVQHWWSVGDGSFRSGKEASVQRRRAQNAFKMIDIPTSVKCNCLEISCGLFNGVLLAKQSTLYNSTLYKRISDDVKLWGWIL